MTGAFRSLGATLLGAVLAGGLAAAPGAEKDPAAANDGKELRVGTLKAGRILILGNSITLHGPNKEIGWTGNWGMAASALEKDYAHVLLDRIAAAAGSKPEAMVDNIAEFERNHATWDPAAKLKKHLEFKADIVVVAIGENVPGLASADAKAAFRKAFDGLLAALKKDAAPVIFVRSTFWRDKDKDEVLRQACQDAGCVFVDISQLGGDESNYARAEQKIAHAGVAAHPGDKGMKAIAELLWKAIAARGAGQEKK
jgi:lysophospholipase L1-like esterase